MEWTLLSCCRPYPDLPDCLSDSCGRRGDPAGGFIARHIGRIPAAGCPEVLLGCLATYLAGWLVWPACLPGIFLLALRVPENHSPYMGKEKKKMNGNPA